MYYTVNKVKDRRDTCFFSYRKNLRIFIYVYIQGVNIFVIENHFRIPESKVKVDKCAQIKIYLLHYKCFKFRLDEVIDRNGVYITKTIILSHFMFISI